MQAYGRDILFKVMDTIVEISKEQERRIMQIEMIKNFYPEYTENNYVLWIIPNLFTDSETTHINGKIKVIKDGDRAFEILPAGMLVHALHEPPIWLYCR